MKQLYIASILFSAVFITACDVIGYAEGYDDGYASGYNTTCKIRATLIHGDWDNKRYTSGYRHGYIAGSQDCIEASK